MLDNHSIVSRALILTRQAKCIPECAAVAHNWICRAKRMAEREGNKHLAHDLQPIESLIYQVRIQQKM